MEKTSSAFIALTFFALSSAGYADTGCQQGLLTQKIEESRLQNWQQWQAKRTIKGDLAGAGKEQTVSVIQNKAANEWGVFIEQDGQKTLLYATTATKALQIATLTDDKVSTLRIINPETKQFYEVSYKGPQDFTVCPKQIVNKPSNYQCTGVAELHPLPPKPDSDMVHYVDFDEDGIQETLAFSVVQKGVAGGWVVTVTDTSGVSTTVYEGLAGVGVSFLNPYALNGGKPVIHLVFMEGKNVKEAVEINYLGPNKFTTCPLSNGKETLSYFGIRY